MGPNWRGIGWKLARKGAKQAFGKQNVKFAEKVLFNSEKPGATKVTPAQAIKGTNLKSYLDKTYAKKCGVEIKQIDLIQTANTLATTLGNEANPYDAIAQGLTDVTRLGNTIEVKKLSVKYSIYANAAATDNTIVRIIIVKQGDMPGAVVPVGQILQTTSNIRSPRALDQAEAFTVLFDRTFLLGGRAAGSTGNGPPGVKNITWSYTPKSCHEIRYTQADTTGALANMQKGNIAVYMMYEGAGGAPSHESYYRAQFVDI